jgi:hypothetical protein
MTTPRPSAQLFDNHRDVNLASTTAMIEDLLIERGYFLNDCRAEVQGALKAWRVPKGSAVAQISLLERPDFPHIRVAAAVFRHAKDVDKVALYGALLQRNTELCGAAFGIKADQILLVAERSTLDLDRSELAEMVTRVQTYADHYDDVLVKQFGGEVGGTLVV